MSKAVTVLTHRRHETLRETLQALSWCYGIDDWRVIIVRDRSDDATKALTDGLGWDVVDLNFQNDSEPPYRRISRATFAALTLGFSEADFVVHLEEDCVPARDMLEYFEWAAEKYKGRWIDSVSAWAPAPPEWGDQPPVDKWYETDIGTTPDDGIGTWGVGTWRRRWEHLKDRWNFDHWDFNLAGPGKTTIRPLVSRVKNIGRDGTQPVEEYDWRMGEQTPAFLPNAPSGGWK